MPKKICNKNVLLLAALLLFSLSACQPSQQASSSYIEEADDSLDAPLYEWGNFTGRTLTVWGDSADLTRLYNQRAFDRYTDLTGNTFAMVELSKEEIDKKLPVIFASQSQEKPDILLGYGGTNVESLHPKENFYNFIDAPWVDDLTDTAINQSIFDGAIIGLPHGEASVSGMLYNQTLFKKHRLDVPTTQKEFLAVCEKLSNAGVTPVYLPYKEITMLLYQFPMDSFLQDQTVLDALNDATLSYTQIPEMQTIVQWYRTMADNGYFGTDYLQNDWSGMDAAMKSKDYAMMLCWDTWLYTSYTGDPTEMGLMPAFMGVPENGCFEGANILLFMVNKNSAQLDVCLDFISFLADPYNYNQAFAGIYTAPVFNNQVGSITTPQYMEAERLINKLFYDSTAWSRVRGFSQFDAIYIQDYMQDLCTAEECLRRMEEARRARVQLPQS